VKALRGAITAHTNSEEAIDEATRELLTSLVSRNQLSVEQIVSVFFTLTPDLNAGFPARAAREMGWDVPMLDMQEVDVPGALRLCIRVLVHAEVSRPPRHAYLRGAVSLRPDLEREGIQHE
jgi:chorismate mutase